MLFKDSRVIEAACGCNRGTHRNNNEDNFYFDGHYLDKDHLNLDDVLTLKGRLSEDLFLAVFDGMGGGEYGEVASYAAASSAERYLKESVRNPYDITPYLETLCQKLNEEVFQETQKYGTEQMGTTMVSLFYHKGYVWNCNLGDSRSYLIRDGRMIQLSMDHVDPYDRMHRKPMLTQYLGIDPEQLQIEPYICSEEISQRDCFLICSDGLTDMVSESDILEVLSSEKSPEECVERLIELAINGGGEDNITVIVARIS